MTTSCVHVTLGPLDHIAPWNIPKSVIYLGLKQGISAQDAYAHLQEGLRRTVAQLPWLGGRVHLQPADCPGWRPGQLEVRYEPVSIGLQRQLHFNQLETDLTFNDIKILGFPLDTFRDESLLRSIQFEPDFERGLDVFTAQANFLPGGCALVISVAAPASDGTAMLSVTRIWADHCSSLVNGVDIVNSISHTSLPGPSIERKFWNNNTDMYKQTPATDEIPSEILHLVSLGPENIFAEGSLITRANGATGTICSTRMKPRLFYLSQAAYSALRKERTAQPGTSEVSGNDLVCSLIWRSVVRAWKAVHNSSHHVNDVASDAISEVAIPFDARPDFMDSLPPGFLGNFNFENRLGLPISYLSAKDTTVLQLAKKIRTHAADVATSANIMRAYGILSAVSDYTQVPRMRAPCMKSASVGILSPMTLPFNEACFGSRVFSNSGRPEAFRPLMGECNNVFRTCFVMPRKPHGGIEFVMTLSDEETDFLDKDDEFSTYAFSMA